MNGNTEFFEAAMGMDAMASLAAFAAWLLTGYLAGRLAFQRTRGRVRFFARLSLFVMGLAIVAAMAKLATLGQLSTYGWTFVADKVFTAPPLFLLPAAFALVFSIPRLWKLARSKAGDKQKPVDSSDGSAASDPSLVVPIQATALGGALLAYLTFFPSGTPSWSLGLILWTIMVSGSAALWFRQQRRHRMMSESEPQARPGLGWRILRAGAVSVALFVGFVGLLVYSAQSSQLPESFSMMSHENVDFGGGPEIGHAEVGHGASEGANHGGMEAAHAHEGHDDHTTRGATVSLTELSGPKDEEPDKRFTLTAEKKTVELASGKTIEAWTFDGKAPGPELRVRQGDLVEIELTNENIEDGATIHWHGVDVPNAEDGVAGLTQNAVMPGENHTYRFVAEDAGTYWYHSHQVSSEQVRKGLFGALIVEPKEEKEDREFTLMAHSWEGRKGGWTATINASDTLRREAVEPGTTVRLRLINTDSYPVTFSMTGASFEVAAIDGTDLNEPEKLTDASMELAAGGRYDVTFTMPEEPVRLGVLGDIGFTGENPDLGLLLTAGCVRTDPSASRVSGIRFRASGNTPPDRLCSSVETSRKGGSTFVNSAVSPDGKGEFPTLEGGPVFDPSKYGEPEETPFDASSDFDREFEVVMDNQFGFHDGTFHMLWTINGEVFPDTPMRMVREGDLVKTTFTNRSFMDHPMHLHGHHVLVLSRNGEDVSGSPWWADTLNVAPGETYEVAFRADNPGVWMDHCHNLDHAATGMTMHLGYEGVSTPFMAGKATGNVPE